MSLPAKIYRHLIRRRLPYGLFSWRFILPCQSKSVRFHRELAMAHFPQIPRVLFLPVMLFTGFRWMFFYSPYYTFKMVRRRGKTLAAEIHLSVWQQYWRVLAVSMAHGLAPSEWYRYHLYQKDSKSLWEYVYDQEVATFHAYRNRGRPYYKEHVALLGDKYRFEQLLKEHGVPGAGTITMLPQHTSDFRFQLEKLVRQHGELFCKRRTGNQGRGAFRAFLEEGQLQLQPRGEVVLATNKVDDFLTANIGQHYYLIQPNHVNHHSLRTYTKDYLHPACTIRIISHFENGSVKPEFAVMHWPVVHDSGQVRFHYPISIEIDSGRLNKTHTTWPKDRLDKTQMTTLGRLIEHLSGRALPNWQEAIQLTCTTHALLKGVDRVAWDFILTEKRPVLLEGNSGWGELTVCQWFNYSIAFPQTAKE